MCLCMPALASSSFAAAEAMLSDALHNLAALFPSHLVALSGSTPSSDRSVLPSDTTHTGAHCRSASCTTGRSAGPGL